MLCLHVGGDGSPWLLHVELSSTFTLSVDILSDRGVKTLQVAANVGDDKWVSTPLFKDTDVVSLLHSCLWQKKVMKENHLIKKKKNNLI